MNRVLLVFGTRPEIIKLAPVYHAMKRRAPWETLVCTTAQHRDMLDEMMTFFKVPGDYDLNVMTPGQDLFDVTTKVLLGMRGVLAAVKPDMLIVQGDTTTVMAASLAAFYLGIPTGHVEAGLRTGDMRNPFPEELNRYITDAVSALHFAPTETARDALIRSGIGPEGIHVTGNTIIDALLFTLRKVNDEPFAALDLSAIEKVALLTTHRRESFGEPLRNTLRAVRALAARYPQLHFVFSPPPQPNLTPAQ